MLVSPFDMMMPVSHIVIWHPFKLPGMQPVLDGLSEACSWFALFIRYHWTLLTMKQSSLWLVHLGSLLFGCPGKFTFAASHWWHTKLFCHFWMCTSRLPSSQLTHSELTLKLLVGSFWGHAIGVFQGGPPPPPRVKENHISGQINCIFRAKNPLHC